VRHAAQGELVAVISGLRKVPGPQVIAELTIALVADGTQVVVEQTAPAGQSMQMICIFIPTLEQNLLA